MRTSANVALVGATGAVGAEVIKILAERNFPLGELRLFASHRSAGSKIGDRVVQDLSKHNARENFADIDIAIFSAGRRVSLGFAEAVAQEGCIVVDNSTAFRMDPHVPLIVPEINLHALPQYKSRGIVANPNCTTAIAMMALAPLHREFGLRLLLGATYQAVSGIGAMGLEELRTQQKALVNGTALVSRIFPHQIVDNIIPQVDDFLENGYTIEEEKIRNEGIKILGLPSLKTSLTCARVPVPRVHCIDLTAQFEHAVTPHEARRVLSRMEGVTVLDKPHEHIYGMPIWASGKDPVQVSRIRTDTALQNALKMWICGDQIRKGAALNAVQIAEELLKIM